MCMHMCMHMHMHMHNVTCCGTDDAMLGMQGVKKRSFIDLLLPIWYEKNKRV